MEVLQKQLDQVKTQLYNMQQEKKKEAEEAPAAPGGSFLRLKPNSGATFLVPGGGEVQLYGNLDVSIDETTKGLKSDYGDNGGMPVGKMGWQPAIATNLSYLGVRGNAPAAARSQFHLATGSGHRYFRDSRHQGNDLEHQRHRQRRVVFAKQLCRLRRQGLGRGHDRKVGDAVQDVDRSPESVLRHARRLPRHDRAIPAATIASNSVCARRTRSGTSRRTGAAPRSRRCTRRARTATTPAASCRRPSRTARAATSPEAVRCRRPATTARSATSTASAPPISRARCT